MVLTSATEDADVVWSWVLFAGRTKFLILGMCSTPDSGEIDSLGFLIRLFRVSNESVVVEIGMFGMELGVNKFQVNSLEVEGSMEESITKHLKALRIILLFFRATQNTTVIFKHQGGGFSVRLE
jgi:hypothetical protein